MSAWFYSGFNKKAEASKENKPKLKQLLAPAAAYMTAGKLTSTALSLGSIAGKRATPGELESLSKNMKRFYKIDPVIEYLDNRLGWPGSHYNPNSGVIVSGKSTGILGHELGHASGPAGSSGTWRNIQNVARRGKGLSISAALMTAGLSDNEKAQNVASILPLVTASPVLAEEAMASGKAIKHIAKQFGARRAFRDAAHMSAALGTYAALPVAAFLGARQIIKLKREKKKPFEAGFRKAAEANGLIGSMPNLASGNKAYSAPGQVAAPKPPNPGIVEAPRSNMPKLPTMAGHSPKHNLSPILPSPQAPKVPILKARRKGL